MKSLFILLSFFLSGCAAFGPSSPIGALTLSDAESASALAKANNDVAGEKCYDAVAAQIKANGAASGAVGILYLNEVKRTSASIQSNLAASCGGVLPITVAP